MQTLRWNEKSYPWVIFFFFLFIYLLYPTNLCYEDGLYFAYHVEHMPLSDTFHPHHLFFLTITQVLYSIVHSVLSSLRGLDFFQGLNSFLGAITLIYIYKLLLAIFKKPLAAFLGAFFYGSTFGFWHYSTDANLYISFNLLLTILLSRYILDKDYFKPSHIVQTALITAFATFIHQLGIFTLIPVGAYLLSKDANRKSGFKPFGLFIGIYLSAVIIPYLLVFALSVSGGKPSPALFAKWITAYGSNTSFWPFLYHDIFYCVNIVARSQYETFLHVIPKVKILYYGKETLEGQSMVNLFNFVLALILVLLIERIHFINFRANAEDKLLYRKLFTWFAPFFFFFWFFAPENYFYRILYLAPLLIFGAGLIASSTFRDKKNIKPLLFALVIFTFIYNAWTGIIPESEKKNNPYYIDAEGFSQSTTSEDLIIFADKERYLAATYRYYFDRDCLHAMSSMRYKIETKEKIAQAKIETANYLDENYQRIFVTFEALQMGVMTYYFSLNNFPGNHPDLMLVDKDQLVRLPDTDLLTQSGTLYRVSFDKPSEKNKLYGAVFIPGGMDAWTPIR